MPIPNAKSFWLLKFKSNHKSQFKYRLKGKPVVFTFGEKFVQLSSTPLPSSQFFFFLLRPPALFRFCALLTKSTTITPIKAVSTSKEATDAKAAAAARGGGSDGTIANDASTKRGVYGVTTTTSTTNFN